MKKAYTVLPIYSADVSGVCSALFELGGLVVMHDPSGCNSTYNTHDETRWYDHDSRIYISALTDRDAVFGDDNRFLKNVQEAIESQKPAFFALACSPIPWMTGTDFPALVKILEKRTGLPGFYVPTNGMHDYVRGAGEALRLAVKLLPDERAAIRKKSLNILGMTPLDFPTPDAAVRLQRKIEEMGYSIVSSWSLGQASADFRSAGEASVNLVVSAVGLAAAKELKKKYGTPFVAGVPVPGMEEEIRLALDGAVLSGEDKILSVSIREKERDPSEYDLSEDEQGYSSENGEKTKKRICLIGEPVSCGSLAGAFLKTKAEGYEVRVLCPLEVDDSLLTSSDLRFEGEEELVRILEQTDELIADPLYRYVLPKNCRLQELPHQAFSGRCFRASMRDISEYVIEAGD